MTTMTIQEQIAVMQAFAKGKRIQSRSNHVTDDAWCPSLHPSWDWYHHEYRVDPTDVDMVKAPLDRSVFEGRIVWLRWPSTRTQGVEPVWHAATAISQTGVAGLSQNGSGFFRGYGELNNEGVEYTPDGKTWLPCHKLVPAS